MKRVGFIGATDKTNLLISLAKILSNNNKNVLIVDTTAEQKFKYIIPTLQPTKTYVTNWEQFDVAVGFNSMSEICQYMGITTEEEEYDFVLMNIDNSNCVKNMKIDENDMNFFVTSMDMYSIRKGMEIFSGIEKKIRISKIIYSILMEESESEYISQLARNLPLEWREKTLFVPVSIEDKYAEMNNQLIYKIGIKSMSSMYKDSIAIITARITDNEISIKEAKRVIKILEKEGV